MQGNQVQIHRKQVCGAAGALHTVTTLFTAQGHLDAEIQCVLPVGRWAWPGEGGSCLDSQKGEKGASEGPMKRHFQ